MGIKNLQKFIDQNAPSSVETMDIRKLNNKVIVFDISILIYRSVIAIQSYGEALTNSKGEVTTHILGLFNKVIWLLEHGIKPIFVFDGKPPSIKQYTLKKRKDRKKRAEEKMGKTDDEEKKNKLSKQCISIKPEHFKQCMKLLQFMGMPFIVAPEEADPQCVQFVKDNLAYGVGTEDMDLLTFGSPIIIRNLFNASQKKKLKKITLADILEKSGLTMKQFINLCVLLGCDYSSTISGIGPKKSYTTIQKYKDIDTFLEKNKDIKTDDNFNHLGAINYFNNAPTVKGKELKKYTEWKKPKYKKLLETLTKKYEFNSEKTEKKILKFKSVYEKLFGSKSKSGVSIFRAKK